MEKPTKPQNIYVKRNRFLSVLAGVFWIILTAGIATLSFYIIPTFAELEKLTDQILMYFAGCFFTVVGLIYIVLSFRNAAIEYVIYTDEKGLYHYSGFVHLGFIAWEDIGDIICHGMFWVVVDNGTRIQIIPKNPNAFWYKLSKLKRFILGLTYYRITVKTLFTNVKAQELYPLLKDSIKYYNDEREEQ